MGRERGLDSGNLPIQTVDELAAIAAVDQQLRLTDERRRHPHLPADVLCVDDKHAGWRNHEVIDVAAGARHTTVMQNDRWPISELLVEPLPHRPLASSAAVERGLVLWRRTKCEQRVADDGVRLTCPPLARGLSPLVLASGAGAGLATIELRRRVRITTAASARDDATARVPPCLDTCSERGAAVVAGVGSLQFEEALPHISVSIRVAHVELIAPRTDGTSVLGCAEQKAGPS